MFVILCPLGIFLIHHYYYYYLIIRNCIITNSSRRSMQVPPVTLLKYLYTSKHHNLETFQCNPRIIKTPISIFTKNLPPHLPARGAITGASAFSVARSGRLKCTVLHVSRRLRGRSAGERLLRAGAPGVRRRASDGPARRENARCTGEGRSDLCPADLLLLPRSSPR